jgi:hypothetical protein
MLYKRLEDRPAGKSKRGSKWMHYADPASAQGSRKDIHYTVLCWSWLNAKGGGMVRCLLPEGAVFYRCDVEAIRWPSWDKDSNPIGETVAIYGCTEQGGNWLHGWLLASHRYTPAGGEADYVPHLEQRK